MSKSRWSIFAQIRMGILPLSIETGRFKLVKNTTTGLMQKQREKERKCCLCKLDKIENELHFLFECPVYDFQRMILYQTIIQNGQNLVVLITMYIS